MSHRFYYNTIFSITPYLVFLLLFWLLRCFWFWFVFRFLHSIRDLVHVVRGHRPVGFKGRVQLGDGSGVLFGVSRPPQGRRPVSNRQVSDRENVRPVASKHQKHIDRPGTEPLDGKEPRPNLLRVVDCVVVRHQKGFRKSPGFEAPGNGHYAIALGVWKAGGFPQPFHALLLDHGKECFWCEGLQRRGRKGRDSCCFCFCCCAAHNSYQAAPNRFCRGPGQLLAGHGATEG